MRDTWDFDSDWMPRVFTNLSTQPGRALGTTEPGHYLAMDPLPG